MKNEANLAYRETEALITDPVRLVVMLYNMLLKDVSDAVAALAGGDIERRAAAIRHAMLVLQELQSSLNLERGGVVARNLERFYNFIRAKLLEGQIKASAEIFEQQITLVSSIRDAWLQVSTEGATPEPLPGAMIATEPSGASQWSA